MQRATTALFTAALALGGCTGIGPERAIMGADTVNPAGANHLIEFPAPITSKDLARMICPTMTPTAQDDGLVAALTCYQTDAAKSPDNAKRLRNDLQHIIMLRSEQNCGMWKTYLQRAGAINRGAFNILSVLTGGAGAVVEGQAASILAATSGAASGAGAAIDAAMLHGLTEGLIFPKVDAVRADLREEIEHHQTDDVTAYSLMRALSDAVRFHGACNVSAALSASTPAAEFGNQIKALTTAVAGVKRATLAVAGASSVSAEPAAATDIKAGAMFLDADGKVTTVTKIDDKATPKTVDYVLTTSTGATPVAAEAIDTFSPKVVGSVLLKPGK